MLHPRKYASFCKDCVGETIDHEPLYVSQETEEGSGLRHKLQLVYKSEIEFTEFSDSEQLIFGDPMAISEIEESSDEAPEPSNETRILKMLYIGNIMELNR